jgi:hypothetical protein
MALFKNNFLKVNLELVDLNDCVEVSVPAPFVSLYRLFKHIK